VKRSKPLTADPAKTAAWRARSKGLRQAPADARGKGRREPAPVAKRKPARNDSAWRAEVLARRGAFCRACGDTADLQIDHVKERSQGGRSVVENGMVLCGPWSRTTPGGCHLRKTEARIVVRPEWLDPDQIDWLAQEGWVYWNGEGIACGRGCRGFADRG
jgi:hypothetical protein